MMMTMTSWICEEILSRSVGVFGVYPAHSLKQYQRWPIFGIVTKVIRWNLRELVS